MLEIIIDNITYNKSFVINFLKMLEVLFDLNLLNEQNEIKCDNKIKEFIMLLDPLNTEAINLLILSICIKLAKISFKNNDLFYILSRYKKNILERYFTIFLVSNSHQVKFMICNFFFIICMNKECLDILTIVRLFIILLEKLFISY